MKMRLLCFALLGILVGCGQKSNNTADNSTKTEIAQPDSTLSNKTKMERFTSKTGAIIRFVDTKLPAIPSKYSSSETRIRKVSSGAESSYFYQIEKKGSYSNKVASIEYSDLLEVIKALSALNASFGQDVASNPDYMENKFVTVDGFSVGYYISGNEGTWFLSIERYGSDNTLFIKDYQTIETAFAAAKSKIEELKK